MTSLGTNSGGRGKRGMNCDFRSSAILAISSSSFSNNLMAWVKVREPIKKNKQFKINGWNNLLFSLPPLIKIKSHFEN